MAEYQRLVNMRIPYLNNLNRAGAVKFLKKAFHEQLSEQPYIEFILSPTVIRQPLTILDDELYVAFELKCNIRDDGTNVKVEDIKCISTVITNADTAFNENEEGANNILYRGLSDIIIYEILRNDNVTRRMFLFRRVDYFINQFTDARMTQLLINSVDNAIKCNGNRGLDDLLNETISKLLEFKQRQ
jgi:hypothetical protein